MVIDRMQIVIVIIYIDVIMIIIGDSNNMTIII